MLIGIDANEANLTSQRVGINQYAFGLLHALHKLETPHQFVIYLKTPPLGDMPVKKMGWNYRVIPFPKAWTQTRLPFDLYTHFPRPEVFLSLTHYAPRFSPIPTVITIMDLGFLSTPDQFTSKDYHQLKSWTAYSVRNAARIIAISEFTKSDIVKIYGRKSSEITVTYPSYDSRIFKPTYNESILINYGIKQPYILFLGSLRPSKNIEGLIRSFDSINLPNLSLVIAGKKGWLYDQIFAVVKELKLAGKVVFTGFVIETDVPVLMTHARAFVMPSFVEGFGIPVLEAMACGTPVVVSKVASLPEVAGNAGIYIDPRSRASIKSGLETACGPRREEFVKLGLQRVKLFSWEHTAKQTMQVLEEAAKI